MIRLSPHSSLGVWHQQWVAVCLHCASMLLFSVMGHYPLPSFLVPAGTKHLLITALITCQLLPYGASGAAPSAPTAAVSWSTGEFLLPFAPLGLLKHETPPQHFHVLERVVSFPFRVLGFFNSRRAAHCRLCFLLLYQKEPALKGCPVLVTKCCRKSCATFSIVRGGRPKAHLKVSCDSVVCPLLAKTHHMNQLVFLGHRKHMTAALICAPGLPWGNPGGMVHSYGMCRVSPEGQGSVGHCEASLHCYRDAAPEGWKVADTWCPASASLTEQSISALTCLASALGLEDDHQTQSP